MSSSLNITAAFPNVANPVATPPRLATFVSPGVAALPNVATNTVPGQPTIVTPPRVAYQLTEYHRCPIRLL